MSRVVAASLWCLFACLMLAGGWASLHACGTMPLFGWQYDACRGSAPRSSLDEVRSGQELRRLIHVAEMRAAEAPICKPAAAPAPPPAIVPSPAAVPTPAVPPMRRTSNDQRVSDEMDQRIAKRQGKTGQLQITLSWNTLDDLDLIVDCPGGRISSNEGKRGPGICGDGEKDIDANDNLGRNVSLQPVENVVWRDAAPSGDYTATVISFRAKSPDKRQTIPFTLRVRSGSQERVCQSEVLWIPKSEGRQSRVGIASGYLQQLSWRAETGLPDCNFRQQDTHFSGSGKQ